MPSSAERKPRAGRPTKEQAEARQIELLDCAVRHFLDNGYDQATIEAIASDVNMTKRTIYARYADKESLFRAALKRAIERHAASPERIEATRAASLEKTLVNIAMLRIEQIEKPPGIQLHRLINTESYRFPDIFMMSFETSALPTVRYLSRILKEETDAGRLALSDPNLAAGVFMSMVVSAPVTLLVTGNPLPASELKERVAFAVRLFLEGAKRRANA